MLLHAGVRDGTEGSSVCGGGGDSGALVPGCSGGVAGWGALLFVRLSTLVVIADKAVVRVPRVFLTSFRVALSSILDSSCCHWN